MEQATIILIDDTECVRAVLEVMLDDPALKVYSFADPVDALAISESIQVDLFIVDMVMRDIGGMEVLRRLNVKEKPFEVIMITGKDDKEAAAEALRLGAFSVLKKPFSYAEFITFVEYALTSAAAKKRQAGILMDREPGNDAVGTSHA